MRELDEHVSDASDQPGPVPSYLADPPSPQPPTLRTLFIKYGWLAGAVGMAVTVLGSWQLTLPAAKHSILPELIHSVGLIIMLGGCGAALIGYRLPWLIRMANALRDYSQPQRNPLADGNQNAETKQAMRSFWLSVLCGGPPLAVVFMLAMWVLPAWAAGLIIYLVTVLLTVTAVVTIGSGSRLQRAFALGAMIPLFCLILELWFASPASAARFGGSSGAYYGDLSFLAEMRKVGIVLDYVGQSRLGAVIIWMAAACAGALAVGVRVALYRINRF